MIKSEFFDRKAHWEHIYQTKQLKEVSWFQANPIQSLTMIQKNIENLEMKIIDIGGGDSLLVDHLLELGFKNVSVLDISEEAINRAKSRLGVLADQVNWIISDVVDFKPEIQLDVWHDRAAFHFLTDNGDIMRYANLVEQAISPGGSLIIGTFSLNGPEKCSGIPIRQYSEEGLANVFVNGFNITDCQILDHITPSGNIQNFIFCSFKRLIA
jgi:2-polyprenyl-3-methyl-5-hydroxy-6-metoxy-1,4-benzoquinol methylase